MNKLLKLLTVTVSLFFISSCSFFIDPTPVDTQLTSMKKASNDMTYKLISDNSSSNKSIDSIGDVSMLIIPVHIEGMVGNNNTNIKNKITKAFIGESEDTSWESVSSFYKKSSYNKLDLSTSVITDWFNIGLNPKEILSKGSKSYNDGGTYYVAEKALEWYKETYNTDAKEFDSNNDGFVDSLWLVYDAPNYSNSDYEILWNLSESESKTFWAFTYWDYNQVSYASTVSPVVNLYGWASYDFLFSGYGKNGIDAHTYIHETGHFLGLSDYYNSSSESETTPLGCIDMMDYNVGDHNAFSKYALGWVTPYVAEKNSITVDISSLTDTGECIILPSSKSSNYCFDEYFMVQYITPTNLNYKDYVEGYYEYSNSQEKIKIYNKAGIMITHVSSPSGYVSGNYFYLSNNLSRIDYVYGNNNSTTKENQLTLMQNNYASDNNVLSSKYSLSRANNALFHAGDSFDLRPGSKFRNLIASGTNELDFGGYFNYKLVVNKLSETVANISILYIG